MVQGCFCFCGLSHWRGDIYQRRVGLIPSYHGSTLTTSVQSLYYYPPDAEFATDNGWPAGWQTPNTALNKLKARLPSTDIPSPDGKRYMTQVFDVVKALITPQGFNQATINDGPNQKDHIYGHPAYNFVGGKR